MGKYLFQQEKQIPGNKPSKKGTKEPRAAGSRQKAADDARHQCRPFTNTHGNISCKNREHHTKRKAADVFKESSQRHTGAKLCRSGMLHINQKGQGNQNAAANNKGKHMRYAVHQMFINLPSCTFCFFYVDSSRF